MAPSRTKSTTFRISSSSSVRSHILAFSPYARTLTCLQFTTTCHIPQRRISGPNTRIVRRMALITTSPIRRWAKPPSRMRAASNRRMLSHATCFPILVLCLIRSSNVKRFGPPVLSYLRPQLTDMVSVRQAPGRTFKFHVFIRRACHPHVTFLSLFLCRLVLIDPLEKRFPNISHERVHQRDIFLCRPGTTLWQQRGDHEQDSRA
jgi:hypothetical protein